MRSRLLFIALGLGFGLAFDATIALAWTGPTASAPNSNIGAPVNVGTTAQIKNGDLGVNNLSVFGNGMLSCLGVSGCGRYLNFDSNVAGPGSNVGAAGYGIRDNGSGTLEFKNAGGNWQSLQAIIAGYSGYWTAGTGGAIYYNGGNVGIGNASPTFLLDVSKNANSVAYTDIARFAVTNNSGGTNYTHLRFFQNAANVAGIETANQSNTKGMLILNPWGGNVGVGTTSPGATLGVAGTVLAAAFLYSSDQRFKDHVTALDTGLVQLMKLRPVSFVWNERSMQVGEKDMGFIAQEIEKILPQLVHTDIYGMKSIDYVKLTPVLVKAIQEQQAEIETLQARVEALEAN